MRKVVLAPVLVAFLAAAAAPSLAAPAQRFSLPDGSQVGLNVCTGNMTTLTLSNRVLVIHEDVDPGQHTAGTLTGDISTADGFAGRFTVHFGSNLQNLPGEPVVGEFVDRASFTLQNGSGAVIVIHAVFHVTIPPADVGEPKGTVDIVSANCLGRSI
jgi:hypothetical protein